MHFRPKPFKCICLPCLYCYLGVAFVVERENIQFGQFLVDYGCLLTSPTWNVLEKTLTIDQETRVMGLDSYRGYDECFVVTLCSPSVGREGLDSGTASFLQSKTDLYYSRS